jgi:N-acetylmuramoyl-L-alanine amidase
MINLVISYSQQQWNNCVMGDSEHDHCRLIAQGIYDRIKNDSRIKAFLMPPLNLGPGLNLKETIRLSNKHINENGGKGFHIEFHTDAGAYAQGCSGLYVSEAGKQFLTPMIEDLMKYTPTPDLGLRKRTDLGVLNQTKAVAGLIEIAFHDNRNEAAWIHENIDTFDDILLPGLYKGMGLEPLASEIDWKQKYYDLKNSLMELIK